MAVSRVLVLVVLSLLAVFAVDRNNFKSCEQSGFCKRLRNYKPDKSPYELNLDAVDIEKNVLTAEVVNVYPEDVTREVQGRFILRLFALADSTFRVQMDEVKPLYQRYTPQLALQGEPKADSLKMVAKTAEHVTVENGQGLRVRVSARPLKIEFLDKKGEPAIVLNDRAQLAVEKLRRRPDPNAENENDENVKEDQDQDETAWSENYKSHHDSKPRGNEAVSMDFAFPGADVVYGVPEHTDGLALSPTADGEPYRLYNLDVFEFELDSRMALYGAVPFVVAHSGQRTVGVFWHNTAETWVDVTSSADGNVVSSIINLVSGSAKEVRHDVRFLSESGLLDAFIMLGDKPSDVTRQYTALTGTAPIPPRFSLGYHQCRWNYVDEADVMSVNENFDVHDIPADVIWLDIEYTDRKKYFTWDSEKFAHPAEMVANLTAKGRKLVVIIDPHIKREGGYFVHEDATDNGFYVKNKDGNDYEGWCWPGSSSYLDFFNPAVSRYYSERFNFKDFPGTSKDVHLWNDMNEPSVFNGPEVTMPKDCRHYRKPEEGAEGVDTFWEHRHVHNEYGLAQIKATHEGMLMRSDGKYRPFILTRSTFAGTQRYAAMWTGDNAAEWGFLAASVPMCLSLGVAGVSFCGSDVGGFFKYPPPEMMTRWYQAGAFQPFFRAHSHIDTKRREPWLYEPATTKLLRDAVRRRYALIDFWYTLFYEHSVHGSPVMRPLFMQYPEDKQTYAIDNEYMLGDALLVRPVVEEKVTSVKVYLPGAAVGELWYDTDTYEAIPAAGYMTQEVNIAKIPVYQRGGSIVCRKERVRRATELMKDDPYTIIVTLDKNGTAAGTLYIDDGETYEYKTGSYIYAKLAYDKDGLTYEFLDKGTYPSRSWVERIVVAGVSQAPRAAKLSQGQGKQPLQMTFHRGNNVLVIRKPAAGMAKPWKISFTY